MLNFYAYELQSPLLLAQNIQMPQPMTDNDLTNPATLVLKCDESDRYEILVRHQEELGNATNIDCKRARKGQLMFNLGEALPAIQRNLAPVGAQAVANIILPQIIAQMNAQNAQMNLQFAHINTRFDFLEQVMSDSAIRIENSHATHDNDPIIPIRHKNAPVLGVPPVPLLPIPANFPATRGELFRLNTAQLNIFLNYYGEILNGTISQKRRR